MFSNVTQKELRVCTPGRTVGLVVNEMNTQ